MFNATIIVKPYDSSAVKRLVWDSDKVSLEVTYNNATYTYEFVEFSSFVLLATYANQRGSWGSGLHKWKKERENEFEREARRQFRETFNKMHPKDKDRWLDWMREELMQS